MRIVKVAIVGMGVAGSYLAATLKDEHEVMGFERFTRESFDAICAWGTSKDAISSYAKECGINFEDYVLHDGKEMLVDLGKHHLYIKLKGLCTFDKKGFVQAMAEGTPIRYGTYVSRIEGGFERWVDATGLTRPLLPKIRGDLLIPCIEYLVKYKEPPFDDFYIRPFPSLTGYFWYFPLGDGKAHVGAGDYRHQHNAVVETFLQRFGGEVLKRFGRPIRIAPPSRCEPFFTDKAVGVGEAIGSVFPLLGEGIIPSLRCAQLLREHWNNLEGYRRAVLKEFAIYETVFRMISSKIYGRRLYRILPQLIKVFLHMKANEERYGLEVRLRDMLKVMGL